MNINLLKEELSLALKDPKNGLPDEVFSFVASVTPMVNVDLLVQDKNDRVLLAWRKEQQGDGWHIPGGIIRFKETFAERIVKTAINELGSAVTFDEQPLLVNEIITPQQRRGHFISFLYRCYLPEGYQIDNLKRKYDDDGYLMWHDTLPHKIVKGQKVYEDLLRKLLV